MDIVFSLFSIIFIALVIGCALFFGFVILMWVIAAAVAFAVFIYIRETIRRWLFIRNATPRMRDNAPDIIEGKYTDITDTHKK